LQKKTLKPIPFSPVLLASSSSFRQLLLAKITSEFDSISPDIDETPHQHESPENLALRLAAQKAHSVCHNHPGHWIIGSDQVAMCGTIRLEKPGNEQNAIQQLLNASGNRVSFYTAVSLLNPGGKYPRTELDICHVYFKTLQRRQIERYIELEKPLNCAGSFMSEGLGISLVDRIEGNDPNALVGLPLILLVKLMEEFGVGVF